MMKVRHVMETNLIDNEFGISHLCGEKWLMPLAFEI
jgi:hypothetical protein